MRDCMLVLDTVRQLIGISNPGILLVARSITTTKAHVLARKSVVVDFLAREHPVVRQRLVAISTVNAWFSARLSALAVGSAVVK